jgi:hypothetical protein
MSPVRIMDGMATSEAEQSNGSANVFDEDEYHVAGESCQGGH